MLRGLPGSIIKVIFFHFIFCPMTNKLCPPLPFLSFSSPPCIIITLSLSSSMFTIINRKKILSHIQEILFQIIYGGYLTFLTPLHPNISIHFLHTVPCTFPMALTKRICFTIKSVFSW